MNKKEILRNATKMSIGRGGELLISILRTLLIPKLLLPAEYGVWRGLLLITQYGALVSLGTNQAMGKEMPYLAGRGEWGKRDIACNNVFVFNVFISFVIGVCIGLAAFICNADSVYKTGVLLFSCIVVFNNLAQFYRQYLRAVKQFSVLSLMAFINPLVNLVFSLLLLLTMKNVLGLVYALLITNIVTLFVLAKSVMVPRFEGVRLIEIRRLVVMGVPMMLVPLMYTLIASIDQLMILTMLSPEELGFYGIALSMRRIIYLVPYAIMATLAPYMFELYGQCEGEADKVVLTLKRILLVVGWGSGMIIIAGCLVVHLPIKYYLTKYIPCFSSLYILAVGNYSMAIVPIAVNYLMGTNQTKWILKSQVTAICASIVFNWMAIKVGYGIEGVAFATSIVYLMYAVMVYYYMHIGLGYRGGKFVLNVISAYAPIIYSGLVALVVVWLFPNTSATLSEDLWIAILHLLLMACGLMPLFLSSRNRGLVSQMGSYVLGKR